MLGAALPVIGKAGCEFLGWNVGGVCYSTLTEGLLRAIENHDADNAVLATAEYRVTEETGVDWKTGNGSLSAAFSLMNNPPATPSMLMLALYSEGRMVSSSYALLVAGETGTVNLTVQDPAVNRPGTAAKLIWVEYGTLRPLKIADTWSAAD